MVIDYIYAWRFCTLVVRSSCGVGVKDNFLASALLCLEHLGCFLWLTCTTLAARDQDRVESNGVLIHNVGKTVYFSLLERHS